MTVARADIDGDGQPDLILLYGQPSRHRFDGGLIPTNFTLKVRRASGGAVSAQIPQPDVNPTIMQVRTVHDRPGAAIFIHESHLSSGEVVGVYAFDRNKLRGEGIFTYGGDSARRYGFTCHRGHPATIVQYSFLLLQGPITTGRWQETVTTYVWVSSRLERAVTHTTVRRGIPSDSPIGAAC